MNIRTATGILSLLAIISCTGADKGQSVWQPEAITGTVDDWSPDVTLGMVTGIALAADGRVFVADLQDGSVTGFRDDGTTIFTLGQSGSGPGDVGMPCCVDVSDDGVMHLLDLANRRYSFFDVSGEQPVYRRSVPSGGSGYFSTDRAHLLPGGGVRHISTVQGGPRQGGRVAISLDSAGVIFASDTFRLDVDTALIMTLRVGPATYRMAAPFAPFGALAFGNSMYARTAGDRYRIELLRYGSTEPEVVIERNPAPVGVSAREADSAATMVVEWATPLAGDGAIPEYRARTTKPPIAAIGFDHDGRLWVQRTVVDGAPSIADLFSASGDYLETRSWSREVQLVSWASRGNSAIGLRTEESGEISLVRLRF